MPDITYRPQPGDPTETTWRGFSFTANKGVSFDGRKTDHKAVIEAAKGNPFFEVEGEGDAAQKAKRGGGDEKPTTAEEYRAYAIEWINRSTSWDEMERRWRSEQKLRDDVGWGSDDQHLIDPIFGPKIENLKRAEAQG